MAESLATELEGAIADTGLLLIELEKFRVAPASPVAALRAEARALGDRARRLHRTGPRRRRRRALSPGARLAGAPAAALTRGRAGLPSLRRIRGDHGLERAGLLVGLGRRRPPSLFHP
jgi:hypothetical protein